MSPVPDRRGYLHLAHRLAAGAVAVRAATLPPAWTLNEPALSAVEPRRRNTARAAYIALRTAGAAAAARDTVRGRVSIRSITATALADALSAKGINGFAPYTDHLYLYAAAVRATSPSRTTGIPVLAYYPAVIYFATGLAKLRSSPGSWLTTGDVVDNAVDLYRWNRIGTLVAQVNPVWLARTVLAYELLALPVSLLGPGWLRAMSMAGLAFHAGNYAALRISFWHLAVMHLPIIAALRRGTP
jgi:hypothetical protein